MEEHTDIHSGQQESNGKRKPFENLRMRAGKLRMRRFRSRNKKNIKIAHLLPNFLTCMNIACGVSAILFGVDGNYQVAAVLILVAGFFDMIDGKVARMAGTASPFGVQLDSLADMISFGVAPPVLVYSILYPAYDRIGLTIVLVYTLCTALRLARYNVNAGVEGKRRHFTGLPCPAPACFVAALVWVLTDDFGLSVTTSSIDTGLFANPLSLDLLPVRIAFHTFSVLLSCLMVSTIHYPDFSSWYIERRNMYQHNVMIVLMFCVAVLIFKYVVLIVSFAFIASGPANALRELYYGTGEADDGEESRTISAAHDGEPHESGQSEFFRKYP